MPIYDPEVSLSETDRELLRLLGQLILSNHGMTNNIAPSGIPLSLTEANRLLHLIEAFVESRYFKEASYFIEGMANGEARSDENLREIYLSWRKRKGRSRTMSSRHWNEFILRAGFKSGDGSRSFSGGYFAGSVRPMPFDHFLRMEKRLAQSANIHPRVSQLILELVSESLSEVENIRQQSVKLQKGIIWKSARKLADRIQDISRSLEARPIKKFELVSISTIVLDASAMFTTRDWTATGVLSNLAATSLQSYEFKADSKNGRLL